MEADPKQDCCKDEANLKIIESTLVRTIRQCAVCGRRHFEFTVDPVSLYGKVSG